MNWMHRRLALAFAFSLLLHALPFASAIAPAAKVPERRPPLEARLQSPAPAAEQPPLMLPEPPRPAKPEPPPRPPRPDKQKLGKTPAPTPVPAHWTAEVRKQLKKLDERGLFYPREAIAQGLEGEAVVLLLLDETGNPAAARIEQSSGHRILDDAALRAVRSLKSLPAEAPRETQLPVRFRLH